MAANTSSVNIENARNLNLYSEKLMNVQSNFNNKLAQVDDLKLKVDKLYDKSTNITSTVNNQLSILKAQKEDIMKEIKDTESQIVAKETEFVDIKSGVNDPEINGPLFTQQDFLTLMLYIAYIFVSVIFYWRTIVTEGFSKKMLAMFLFGWSVISIMLFSLFNRFV
jgi:hypothetical protein